MSETQPNIPEEKLVPVLQRPEAIIKFTQAILPIYKDSDLAQARIMAEIMEFNRTLNMIKAEDLAQIPQSEIYRVALSSFASGLSWAAEEGNFYLKTRNVNIAPKGQTPKYVKGLEHSLSTNGETSLRQMQKIIKGVSGPFVVYEGDEVKDIDFANKSLVHKPAFPRSAGAKVIAVYGWADLPDGRREFAFLQQADFDRLANYSRKEKMPKDARYREEGKEYANELYFSYNGGIDPEFACRKCIRKLFKPLPKCKTFGMPIQSELEDPIHPTTVIDDHGDAHIVDDDTPVTSPGQSPDLQVIPETEDEF